jgi:cytochrome c oxidase subunit II
MARGEGAEDVILNERSLKGFQLMSSPRGSRMAAIAVFSLVVAAMSALQSGAAFAQQMAPWQISLQAPNTLVAEHIHSFAALTFWIVGIIVLFVLGLLVYVMVKFNAKANPVPSRVSHNTVIEIVWTVVPILILVIIAIPSLRLLYEELEIPPADLTIKAIGRAQWAWGYEYSDILDAKQQPVLVDSTILDDSARTDPVKQPRLLSVDNNLIVPVGKVVKVLVTADADSVIHSFAVPSFGIKVDAMPGRLNETWFKAERTGIYYGQCSELCGRNHALMPIAVQVVTEEQFKAWSEAAKKNLDQAYKVLAAAVDADVTKINVAAR